MKSSKPLITMGAALASVALLAGCTSGSSSGSSGNATSVKSLTMWLSTSTAQERGYQDLAAEYQKQTGVEIKLVNIPHDGYATKLREAAQANALPDVARTAGLDPIWAPKTIDLSSIVKTSSDNINKDVISTASSGKVSYIPSDVTAAGLFVNASLFKKAGVAYPTDPSKTWTWTQFVKAADQVRAATGAKYDLVVDDSPSRLRAYMFTRGTDFMQQQPDGSFPANANIEAGLQSFVDMNNDTTMPKSVWTSGQDPNALFKSGQVVAYFSGVWQTADFASNITNFDWASATTPAQPTHATEINYGGLTVGFNNSSAEAAAAKQFIAWTYEPKNYSALVSTNGFLPVESGLNINYPFTSQAAKSSFALYNNEIAQAAPISSSFAQMQAKWALEGKVFGTDPTTTEVAKAINNQESVQTALQNINAAYKKMVG